MIDEKTRNDWNIAQIAFWSFFAAIGVWLAAAVVWGWAFGGPEGWATFGDYLGGVVNPVIGVVTVLLIVRTLKTTREEAADTRAQFVAQLEELRRQHTLAELQKRLNGAMEEWRRVMDAKVRTLVRIGATGITETDQWSTVGAALYDGLYTANARTIIARGYYESASLYWSGPFEGAAALAVEIASYCRDYQAAAGDNVVADFYRRRVYPAAEALEAMDQLETDVMWMLYPEPLGVR